MHLLRFLRPNLVLPEMQSAFLPADGDVGSDAEGEETGLSPPPEAESGWKRKEAAVREIAGLFDRSGQVRNLSKFTRDLLDRERKSTTALGGGLAIPHVRSMQPRRLVVAVARSREGVEYLAEDGSLTHVFFALAAPPYDDSDYWKLYRWVARAFAEEEWLVEAILEAASADEMVKIMRGLR